MAQGKHKEALQQKHFDCQRLEFLIELQTYIISDSDRVNRNTKAFQSR